MLACIWKMLENACTCIFTAGDGVWDVCGLIRKNMRILHGHLKKITYICFMEKTTFTYYKHLHELDMILISNKFIDGETYVIRKIDPSISKGSVLHGNFYINKCLLENGRWVYRDVIKELGLRLENHEVKKIMAITQPLKFKQIR